jgi:4-phytase/acid phosphatase
MRLLAWLAALAALAATACSAAPTDAPRGYKVERVVVLMRHGVRPPTRPDPLPAGLAAQPLPAWDVPWGRLTAHGRQAILRLGAWERTRFMAQGLVPSTGCPAAGAVDAWADTDERTISTADTLLEQIAPGCGLVSRHLPQDTPDPLFQTILTGSVDFDNDKAAAALVAHLPPGGVPAIVRAHRREFALADRILRGPGAPPCPPGAAIPNCRLADMPGGLDIKPGQRPRTTGPIDAASATAQLLLLEYADGKPISEVGWGRASGADVARLSAIHAVQFDLLARPPYAAARIVGPIALDMVDALQKPGALRLYIISGHDTDLAALGGLMDLHWSTPGFARDDPPPGGGFFIELLSDKAGKRFVRALWVAAGAEAIRNLAAAAPHVEVVPIPGCTPSPRLCALDAFGAMVRARAVPLKARPAS